MNELIIELANKANEDVGYTFKLEDAKQIHTLMQKFAKLIVRECGFVAWEHTPETEELEYSHLIKDKILQHFGIEE
ncbi:hypothetical protein UFOVP1309_85 [uncultured Caudovirales phage]|uniref:Uncharacterized protein n=1 Tax=uncultured Caudovirales phage TaxID=2100421 RepID=A0A6J5RVR4_9CAUD|nr:hypothetical protein UFOVP1309_85 [uncultured Caudovirales phage]